MSQSDLGEVLGISYQQVQKYEWGFNRIGSSRLQEIARSLGVAPDYFFENQLPEVASESDEFTMTTFNEFLSSSDGVRLMQAFVKIKKELLKRTIVRLVADLGG